MFKGTREFLKFAFPIIESIIISSIFGVYQQSLAFTIVFFIGLMVFTYIFGVIIRAIGWGVIGYIVGEQSYFLVNISVTIILIVIRFGLYKLMKI
jgi:hypothetical protein